MDANRPHSDLLPTQSTPEAKAINQWFSDLSYYETTLEQMAAAKLDDGFRDELKAIEQWFSVLSDPERLGALCVAEAYYACAMLQQMAAKDSGALPLSTVSPIGVGVKHSSAPNPLKCNHTSQQSLSQSTAYTNPILSHIYTNTANEIDLLSIATGNSLRLSMEHPKTPIDQAIAQADWSTPVVSPMMPSNPVSPGGFGMPQQSPVIPNRTVSSLPHPGDGWGHVNLATSGGRDRGRDILELGDRITVITMTLDSLLRSDLVEITSLAQVFTFFEGCTWRQMVVMTDAELEARGVAAMGARNKLLKVFELVRMECAKNGIAI
ncbi:hypothetical protein BCR33DRAFT_852526 [Rhizoclosmatium globosum]|uniref:SAM domain-containing protein n=1 Tax=Rhizoclosmatium globosum TaxID=329046 RepID=A0A1Y2C435_9FUNG|nr:hypothetical protein BCR33DRAFT_852526 [Rhizoclosmatium globosum]|eukprot:ORY41075.1 hypothetical protein BCR33DRAFT_852526 [Rhizoclosmatium globosum]